MTYRPFNIIIQQAAASSSATSSALINSSGSTIAALTPIRVDNNGDMRMIDVSLETSALSVAGLTIATTPHMSTGEVITQGRLTDITIGFAVGDYVYVSKSGTLTNVLPTNGANGFVDGDFIIRIGVVAKNELDSNKKDLFVNISVAGQM